jgi:hypothetical protein
VVPQTAANIKLESTIEKTKCFMTVLPCGNAPMRGLFRFVAETELFVSNRNRVWYPPAVSRRRAKKAPACLRVLVGVVIQTAHHGRARWYARS